MRTTMRHTGGALTAIGITLILIGALIANTALPAGAAQKGGTDTVVTSSTADDSTTTTASLEDDNKPKDDNKPNDDTSKDDDKPKGTTTTSIAKTDDIELAGRCELDKRTAYFVLTVTMSGRTGATGTVITDTGLSSQYTIGDSGTATVTIGGHAGTNSVTVIDGAGTHHTTSVVVADCAPAPMQATAHAACDKGDYLITFSISGEPGDTGEAVVDGIASRFTLDAGGTANLTVGANGRDVTVEVRSDGGKTVYGPVELKAEECVEATTTTTEATTTTSQATTTTTEATTTSTTTTRPEAVDAEATGACAVVGAHPAYRVAITVRGDAGATGVIEVDGATYDYLVYDQGSSELIVATDSGKVAVMVTDSTAGIIFDTTLTIDECAKSDVLAAGTPTPAGQGSGGAALAQPELPFTGPYDGPIAAAGAVLLVAGALLLIATRPSDEDDLDLAIGWTVRR